jgi:hypothetical protein
VNRYASHEDGEHERVQRDAAQAFEDAEVHEALGFDRHDGGAHLHRHRREEQARVEANARRAARFQEQAAKRAEIIRKSDERSAEISARAMRARATLPDSIPVPHMTDAEFAERTQR